MPAIDQFGNPVIQDQGYRLGRLISQIFHPISNGILSFLIVGLFAPDFADTRWSGIGWALLVIALLVLPPTIYFYYRLVRGHFSDDDVSQRTQRHGLYIFSLGTALLASLALYALSVPPVYLRLIGATLATLVACMLINFFWKVSVHSASIAALATISARLYLPLGLFFWLAAFAVAWARIRTGNHTAGQVLAGWLIAAASVLIAL
ncbi:phosphatase PAP2 family protein [Kallotenue papyrolyticum]|uniref:phosphatase PAP2 family protein n=1 Tax=Kallotenue papyrolyticum TaxID=1325125 RepID=UPI0004785BE7|nr:phosphatase PAP2 family protein [Kallotenue papyrolyticum]